MGPETPGGRSDENEKKFGSGSFYRDYAPYLSLGFQLAIIVALFFFLGDWLDRRYEIAPVGKLVCTLLGLTGGFIKFFRSISMLVRDEERRRLKRKNEN
jgi:F0F1-type ATP synthase assembly protein I